MGLASGAEDGLVIIWREGKPSTIWKPVRELSVSGSATAVEFCPHEYGLVLAIASSAGEVIIVTCREVSASPLLPPGEMWHTKSFEAHQGGTTCLSWSPSTSPGTLATGPAASRAAARAPRRIVTGGLDHVVRVWQYDEQGDTWSVQQELEDAEHKGLIRDVYWRPNLGIPTNIIASCTEYGSIAVWQQDMSGCRWECQSCWQVDGDARRLNWTKAGTLLTVSVEESRILFFKEGPGATWAQVFSTS